MPETMPDPTRKPTSQRLPEPVIVGASIAGGHDGAAELIVQVRFENGAVRDVAMENDTGLALMAVCGVDSVEALVGQPWQRFLQAVGQRPART